MRRLAALDILAGSERARILRDWNATAHAVPSRRTCRSCLRRRRARTPDAVAVVFEDRELSYAALDAHANQLAHHLRAQGVGPETVVGLCVERSLEMVIGLLGILKAGARLPAARSRRTRRSGWRSCWRTPAAPVLVTQQALLERLPALALRRRRAGTRAGADAARRRLGRDRGAARATPPALRIAARASPPT